ncbi:hypothetical protein [Streptomyces sp. NPDC004763]
MPVLPYATWDHGVDLVAVERVLEGTLPHTALDDDAKRYAARLSRGTPKRIGALLGVSDKTVTAWREAE